MALNPFFLQGSPGEQRLVQDLINEQLKIYGVEVTYIPRKFVRKETIISEVTSSKFNDNFLLEAYVNTYDGYGGAGDILTKFGMSLRDELSLVISKERFQDFISPFLAAEPADEIVLSSRPKEGDLIYFPLGQRLFEVKFVEHEQPFYQLGKTYVYEIKCELFEYEDEVIDTSVDEIDTRIQNIGHITTLNLIGTGSTATAIANIGTGYIRKIFLNNDGYNYTKPPVVAISSAPDGGTNAKAIAKIWKKGSTYSVKEIILTNAGLGYTTTPIITISGGGGTGAAATCSIETVNQGVISFTVTDGGVGYTTIPLVTITGSVGTGQTAVGIASLGTNQNISNILISDSGVGYSTVPSVVIGNPTILTGIGTYLFNEIVIGSQSGTQARVKEWDQDTKILKISYIGINSESTIAFYPGEIITGSISSARYSVATYDSMDIYDKYNQNDEIEAEADLILDFSESNPFGTY